MKVFAQALIAGFVALLALGFLLLLNTNIPDVMWVQLRPILCGAGQHLQIGYIDTPWHTRSGAAIGRALTCVAPDGTTDDVSLAAYLVMYGALYPVLWVAVYYYLLRRKRKAESTAWWR